MTRRLVLTHEAARHPFRRALPPPAALPARRPRSSDDDSDWKLFLLSFAAFFSCFAAFIL